MLILCNVAPAHRKREREKEREHPGNLYIPNRKGCIMGNRLSKLALKIVVHSVGGSRQLLGVELNLRNQPPTVAFLIKDNS